MYQNKNTALVLQNFPVSAVRRPLFLEKWSKQKFHYSLDCLVWKQCQHCWRDFLTICRDFAGYTVEWMLGSEMLANFKHVLLVDEKQFLEQLEGICKPMKWVLEHWAIKCVVLQEYNQARAKREKSFALHHNCKTAQLKSRIKGGVGRGGEGGPKREIQTFSLNPSTQCCFISLYWSSN